MANGSLEHHEYPAAVVRLSCENAGGANALDVG
jgi:hypothetical protein